MTRARTLADIADLNIDSNTLVIDTSNNRVGIGTASPDRSLHIAGSEPSVVFENTGQGTDLKTWRIYSNSSSLQVGTVDDAFSAGQNALEITRDNTDNITGIQFKTGASSERMRIDANNCVGINITPSSWSGHNGVLQVGNSSVANFSNGAYLNANSYYDGSNNRYIATDEASRYYQSSGQHVWQSAASGTAGNAISFSTKMMINASGNVGIGTSSPAVEAHIQTASGNPELRVESTGANYATVSVKNSSRHYSTQIRTDQSNAYVIRDETGGANRFLISTGGNVTMPSQPAFLAKPSSNQSDIATGANITVALGNEIYDVGSNFASNIFTAPVTGKYLFIFTLYGSQLDGDSSYFEIAIVTSNRGYAIINEPSGSEDVYAGGTVSVVADMDANDTAYARVAIGSGQSTFDITTSSNFSGALIC